MIVVVACAGDKAGSVEKLETENNETVMFVTIPLKVPTDKPGTYKPPR